MSMAAGGVPIGPVAGWTFFEIPWSPELGNGWSVGGMASIFWTTEEGKIKSYMGNQV
jgi:hypothetical protein